MSEAHLEALPHDPASHAAPHHGAHNVNYFAIFIALLVCTALSVVFDVVPMNGYVVTFLVLAVATAKALFVMTYFMHLKFEGGWKFVILLPTAILAVGMMIALTPDIGLHYYTPDVPQVRAYEAEKAKKTADKGDPQHELERSHDGSPTTPADKVGH